MSVCARSPHVSLCLLSSLPSPYTTYLCHPCLLFYLRATLALCLCPNIVIIRLVPFSPVALRASHSYGFPSQPHPICYLRTIIYCACGCFRFAVCAIIPSGECRCNQYYCCFIEFVSCDRALAYHREYSFRFFVLNLDS